MGTPKKDRRKLETLRQQGCLNSRPERVEDELFANSEFFDVHDLLQVKYEMVRRVQVDGVEVSTAARTFGVSRPTVYQAIASFEAGGLGGLLPRRPGPRGAHKLNVEVVDFILGVLANDPELKPADLVAVLHEQFALEVHPRSIERAVARAEKKNSLNSPSMAVVEVDVEPGKGLVEDYENLRDCAMTGRAAMVRRGLAVLLQSGMASWMRVCRRATLHSKSARHRIVSSALRQMPGEQWSQIITLLADVAMQRFAEEVP